MTALECLALMPVLQILTAAVLDVVERLETGGRYYQRVTL